MKTREPGPNDVVLQCAFHPTDPMRFYNDRLVVEELRQAEDWVKEYPPGDEWAAGMLRVSKVIRREYIWRECVDFGILFLVIIILGCLFMIFLHKRNHAHYPTGPDRTASLSTSHIRHTPPPHLAQNGVVNLYAYALPHLLEKKTFAPPFRDILTSPVIRISVKCKRNQKISHG